MSQDWTPTPELGVEVTLTDRIEVELLDHMGSDQSLAHAARTSTRGEAATQPLDPEHLRGLIRFLMRDRHGSPFEHAAMTFRVSAPIFVLREWHRHRVGHSYNEASGRYRELEPKFYLPGPDRALVQVGRPGAYEYVPGEPDQVALTHAELAHAYRASYSAYQSLLRAGIAREVARMALPVSIFTTMHTTLNPRSLMHFLGLRTKDPRASKPSFPMAEIAVAAGQMEAIFADLFPVTYEAFNDFGRVAP